MSEVLSDTVAARLTASERKQLTAVATSYGIAPARFIRAAVLSAIRAQFCAPTAPVPDDARDVA